MKTRLSILFSVCGISTLLALAIAALSGNPARGATCWVVSHTENCHTHFGEPPTGRLCSHWECEVIPGNPLQRSCPSNAYMQQSMNTWGADMPIAHEAGSGFHKQATVTYFCQKYSDCWPLCAYEQSTESWLCTPTEDFQYSTYEWDWLTNLPCDEND